MSWPPPERAAEALRRAWAAADREEAGAAESPAGAEAERIWRAVAGELPPDELRALAEAAARDPEVAQAWRLARELRSAMPAAAPGGRLLRLPSLTVARRWAVAATVAIALGAGLWWRLTPEPPPVIRGGETGTEIAPLVKDGAALSRHALVLRWTTLPDPRARYTLRVTTADLAVIAEVRDLATAEYRIPRAALAAVPAGGTLLWQVDVRLADSRVVSSPTSHVILRD